MSGKEELFRHINNEIIQKVGNLKSIQEFLVLKSNYFDPIDYYFALRQKLNEMNEKKEIDCLNKFLSRIINSNVSCNNLKEYFKKENQPNIELILKNTYEYLIEMSKKKSHLIFNKLNEKEDLNSNEILILKYCLIYNLMRGFANNKKIRDKYQENKEEIENIYKKLLNNADEFSNQIKENLEKNIDLLGKYFNDKYIKLNVENGKIKSVDALKPFLDEIFEEFKTIEDKLKINKISKLIEDIQLNGYNEIFENIRIDILEKIYLEDLNLRLTIPKQKLIKTFETTGFLLDNHLASIIERILMIE